MFDRNAASEEGVIEEGYVGEEAGDSKRHRHCRKQVDVLADAAEGILLQDTKLASSRSEKVAKLTNKTKVSLNSRSCHQRRVTHLHNDKTVEIDTLGLV